MNEEMSVLSVELMDKHLESQARDTVELRKIIYDKIPMKSFQRIVELGCGTGRICGEIRETSGASVAGLDVDGGLLEIARKNYPDIEFVKGDAHETPFEANSFDLVFCHFFLMWTENPYKILFEMKKLAKPGGYIVAASEPDYGGKIDYPDEFNNNLQAAQFLRRKGADPLAGRKLRAFFSNVDLEAEVGVFASLLGDEKIEAALDDSWRWDAGLWGAETNAEKLESVKKRERDAIKKGERIAFLPIFYAIGKKEVTI